MIRITSTFASLVIIFLGWVMLPAYAADPIVTQSTTSSNVPQMENKQQQ